ncbi:MAG: multicopper oxidase domain-containing protein [Chloroflexi bacterium]|nr:multicopper oxidase domain-containing protein [Chloroflexota bacterium]
MGVLLSIGLTSAQETRHYYIAADEVEWDYAPGGNLVDPSFDEAAAVFLEGGPDRIGSTYVKAVYREYTDDTFSTLKPRAPEWEHLGLLGPVLRAEVGDTIAVHFKNNTSFPASVHPHGVFYNKDSEGAPYNDGTSGADRADDAVAPGETHTYLWQVPERAGPGPMDPSSVMWSYHSHVDEAGDTNAGLIGPMIITAKGKARKDGSPKGVDREFVAVYSVFDENRSLYIDNNIETFLGMDPSEAEELKADDEFNESNLMHGINGYVYGNLPGLTMRKGERVRWYMMGMGTEVDLHTPHWHGQTLVQNGMRTDVTELLPMSMKVADMVPDNPGTWFFHCHVNDHIDAGMMAMFTVQS